MRAAGIPRCKSSGVPHSSWYTSFRYLKKYNETGAFHLRENDFCFGPRKFGGNAQSITRQRFCHHTSFLCDFDDAAMMRYLKLPGLLLWTILSSRNCRINLFTRCNFMFTNAEKAPSYRGGRSHLEFLCKLKDAFAHHHLPPHTSSVSNTPSALSGNHASAPPVDRAQYAADELCASLRRTLDEEFEVWHRPHFHTALLNTATVFLSIIAVDD